MNAQDFAYWLQGFFEMTETNKLSEKQVLIIKEHLKLVFTKLTPENPLDIKKFEKTLISELEKLDDAKKKLVQDRHICSGRSTRYC